MSDHSNTSNQLNRRQALRCMAWAGGGIVWVMNAGVPKAFSLGGTALAAEIKRGNFMFAQISDSHIGFSKEANPDTAASLQLALDQMQIIKPAFMLHTGDVTHLSKPAEFDIAAQLFNASNIETHYVPGEHDVLDENANLFFERYTPANKKGWYSFDYNGVHFIALVNVMNFKAGGLGRVGAEQLQWLDDDLRDKSSSTPVVVFSHIPLWNVYSAWGWATDDGDQVFALLRRFGSVTLLNGHIHQVIQKIEGNLTFHSAMSTAYPQPEPGKAAGPGPLKVPAQQLRSVLGTSAITFAANNTASAILDHRLSEEIKISTSTSFLDSIFAGD